MGRPPKLGAGRSVTEELMRVGEGEKSWLGGGRRGGGLVGDGGGGL